MVLIKKFAKMLLEGKFFITIYNRLHNGILKIIKGLDFYSGFFFRWIASLFLTINKNQVVFYQCMGGKFICNPKYVLEKLHELMPTVDIYWVVKKEFYNKVELPEYVNKVVNTSWKAYKIVLTSKVILDNGYTYQESGYIPKKNEQVYIQLWHGSLGLKRFDTDSIKSRLRAAIRCGKMTDYCVSNSKFETEKVYREVFWKHAEILEWGHPRNDILFIDNYEQKNKITEKIKTQYDIDDNSFIVLYAPTFRDKKNEKAYSLDIDKLITTVEFCTGKKCVLLWRYHFSSRNLDRKKNIKQVIDVTDYPDIQELMLVADMGITDYSSWICDFVLTKKPGFIFAPDISEYDTERGFYYPLTETPFPVAYDNEMLRKNIMQFDFNEYEQNVDSYLKRLGCIENGKASFMVANFIIDILKGNVNK